MSPSEHSLYFCPAWFTGELRGSCPAPRIQGAETSTPGSCGGVLVRSPAQPCFLCRSCFDTLPMDLPVSQARCIATARSCPSSFTEKGLANSVLRSTCAVLAGMRQSLARRSCTRRGLSAVIRAGNWVGDSANGSHRSIMFGTCQAPRCFWIAVTRGVAPASRHPRTVSKMIFTEAEAV